MTTTPRIWSLAFAVSLSTLLVGCDHTRRIRQSVTLHFSTAAEEDGFSCQSVSIRENAIMTEVDKKREAISPGRFKSLYPWHGPVKLNDMHEAVFSVEEVLIVDVGDKTPRPSQHPLSGKSFLVKLEGCDKEGPVMEIVLVEGEVAVAGKYSVKVTDVAKALYVK